MCPTHYWLNEVRFIFSTIPESYSVCFYVCLLCLSVWLRCDNSRIKAPITYALSQTFSWVSSTVHTERLVKHLLPLVKHTYCKRLSWRHRNISSRDDGKLQNAFYYLGQNVKSKLKRKIPNSVLKSSNEQFYNEGNYSFQASVD